MLDECLDLEAGAEREGGAVQMPEGEAEGESRAAQYRKWAKKAAKEGRAITRADGEAESAAGAVLFQQYARRQQLFRAR